MVLIVGAGPGRPDDLGEVAPTVCPNCHNEVFLHHVRSTKRVSLFFVPVMPYGTNEYLVCPICRSGLELSAGQSPKVRQMRTSTGHYRRGSLPADAYRAQVERFWAGFGTSPAGTQLLTAPAAVTGTATAPPAAETTLADRLAQLGRLHADGILTDEEFSAAKARLLGRSGPEG